MTETLPSVHFLREVRAPRYGPKIRVPAVDADGAIRDASTALLVFRRLGIEAPLERFICLFLDNGQRPLGFSAWDGAVGEVAVYPQNVLRLALSVCAAAVIVGHNHPSGDPSPSPQDRTLTAALVFAGSVLSVPLVDHVIVGEGRHYSFEASGLVAEYRRAYERWRAACP